MSAPPKLKPSLASTHARSVLNQYSFGRIKSLRDCLLLLGYDKGELEYAYPALQLDSPVSFSEVRRTIEIWKEKEEHKLNGHYEYSKDTPLSYEFEGVTYKSGDGTFRGSSDSSRPSSNREVKEESAGKEGETEEQASEIREELFSPKIAAHIKLYKFQQKASLDLLKGIERKLRCQLLRAGTGVGKTFILSAVLRKLFDTNFFDGCLAPFPAVWITRASVVEQTKRVAHSYFGIEDIGELLVINIEQMRAKMGELFLTEETHIERGEEHIKWTWRYPHHPKVFIIDESHLAKNPDSTQSKIIYSLSEVEKEIYIICSSATPFTRVVEAGYMAINTHMEIK